MAQTASRQLVDAVWEQLRHDREVLALPVLGAVFSASIGAILMAGGFVAGVFDDAVTQGHPGAVTFVWGLLVTYTLTAFALYFQAAVLIAADARMDGRDPSLDMCLREATARLPQILAWALLATTVNAVLRGARERGLGRAVASVAGLAWTVATFLALPMVVFERRSPIDAVRASGRLIADTWGNVVRTGVRFGLRLAGWWVLCAGALVVGLTQASQGAPTLGAALFGVGVIGFAVLAVVGTTLTGYLRVALYRHAKGLAVPGVAPELLPGAFTVKGA